MQGEAEWLLVNGDPVSVRGLAIKLKRANDKRLAAQVRAEHVRHLKLQHERRQVAHIRDLRLRNDQRMGRLLEL